MQKRGKICSLAASLLLLCVILSMWVVAAPPTVNLVRPTPSQVFSETRNILFNVTASSTVGLRNCTVYTNRTGTWTANYTKSMHGVVNSSIWNITKIADGYYKWNARCCDTSSNCSWYSSNSSFRVAYATAPTVTLLSPINGYNTSSRIITHICNVSDLNLKNVTLFNNAGGTWHANKTNTSGVSVPYTFIVNYSQSNYKWNCKACDGINPCVFASSNRTFIVDLTPPRFVGKGHNNASSAIAITTKFKIWANITDGNKVRNASAFYDGQNALLMTKAANYSINTTPAVLGITTTSSSHKVTVRSCDYAGNCNSTNVTGINVDATYPRILSFTANMTYVKSSWVINFTARVNDSSLSTVKLNYTKSSSMTNVSSRLVWYVKNTTAQMSCSGIEGVCTFNLVATDIAGNVNNSKTLTIRVDDLKPRVASITLSDTDYYVRLGQSVVVNVTVADANLSTVTIGGVSVTRTTGTNFWTRTGNVSSLGCTANSACNLNVTATDLLGNVNSTMYRTVYVDGNAPKIVISRPLNWTNSTSNLINFTITDSFAIRNTSINVTGVGNYSLSYCSGNRTKIRCVFKGTSLSQGWNTITVGVKDKADNSRSNISAFKYDTAGPAISAHLSPSSSLTNPVPNNLTLFYSINDTYSTVSRAWYRLDGKPAKYTLNPLVKNITLSPLLSGSHSIILYSNDTLKNNNTYNIGTFYVRGTVNLTNFTNNLEKGDLTNVTLYYANGTRIISNIHFNRSIRLQIRANATFATTNITINMTLFGLNMIIANSNKPVVEINKSSSLGVALSNKIGGKRFTAVIMYRNMSQMIPDSSYTNISGVAQWVAVHMQRSLGTDAVVYMSDDTGTEIYSVSQCAGNVAPSPPASLAGRCYINGTRFVKVFVPHLSGVGLVNPNYAPSYSVQSPGTTVTDSKLDFNGMIYDIDLNTSSCYYNLTIGPTARVAKTSLAPTLAHGTTNYTFSVYYESQSGFWNLTNGTRYNVTISCASSGNGNRSKSKTQFRVSDITGPSVSIAVTLASTRASINFDSESSEEFNYTFRYWVASGSVTVKSSSDFSTSHGTTLSDLSLSSNYYYNYTVCDRSKNCNTSSTAGFTTEAATTPAGPSGGGGGGGVVVSATKTNKYWEILRPGTYSIPIVSNDYGVKKITFRVANTAQKVTATVEWFSVKPSSTAELNGQVYKYVQIGWDKLTPDQFSGDVKIEFKVPKTWLESNKLSPADIVLKRYVDNAWVSLDTVINRSTTLDVFYGASSPGFSYFAIGAKSSEQAIQPQPEQKPVEEQPAEVPATEPTPAAPKPAEPKKAPSQAAPAKKQSSGLIVTLIIVAVALFLTSFFIFRHRKKPGMEHEAKKFGLKSHFIKK
jgi:PGF-pre-PGF domain-containing protein